MGIEGERVRHILGTNDKVNEHLDNIHRDIFKRESLISVNKSKLMEEFYNKIETKNNI